jgi:hypothetical protein
VLIRTSPSESLLLMSWHHLVVDGWSARLFLRSLEDCYADETFAPISTSPTLCDINERHVAETRSAAFGARVADAAARLRDVPVHIVWPDRAGAGEPGCGVIPLHFDGELVRRLEHAAARRRITLAGAVCGAYQRAVAETWGLGGFLAGCAVDERGRLGAEEVAGYLVNTVLVRCQDPHGLSADAYITSAAKELSSALAFQDVPFPALAARMRGAGPRSASFPQVYFSFDAQPELHLQGLRCTERPLRLPRAKFDLTLTVRRGRDGIAGALEHRTRAVSHADAATLGDRIAERLADFAASDIAGSFDGDGPPREPLREDRARA